MGKDSAARIELGRSFHQVGTVNEKTWYNLILVFTVEFYWVLKYVLYVWVQWS